MTLFIGYAAITALLCAGVWGLVCIERDRAAQRESEAWSGGYQSGYVAGKKITDLAASYADAHPHVKENPIPPAVENVAWLNYMKVKDHVANMKNEGYDVRTHEETGLMPVEDEQEAEG